MGYLKRLTMFVLVTLCMLTGFGVKFALAEGGNTIEGYIYDKDGYAITNAWVWVDNWNGGGTVSTTTDTLGYYSLSGLANGQYRLTAEADNCVKKYYLSENNQTTLNYDDAASLTFNSTTPETIAFDFTLEPGGTISGKVYDNNGVPQEGIRVDCWIPGGASGNATQTKSDGSYAITGLSFGNYKVRAPGENTNDAWAPQYYNHQAVDGNADLVSISTTSPDALSIDFDLIPAGSISGYVRDTQGNPLPNAHVWADYWDGEFAKSTQTDASGFYTLSGLGAGQFRIAAEASGKVKRFYQNSLQYDNAIPVSLSESQNINSINFVLEAGGTILGTVQDSQGNPLKDLQIDCWRIDGPGGNGTQTDDNGHYTITGLPYGTYKLKAPGGNSTDWITIYYSGKSSDDQADTIKLTSTTPNPTEVDFTLYKGSTIRGTVTNGGTALAYADVWAEPYNGGAGKGTRTDTNGSYSISGLSPGQYRMGAKTEGLVTRYYNNQLLYENANPVTVASGDTLENIDFQLEPGGNISGQVKDADQNPLSGIQVDCWRVDGGSGGGGTKTAANGTFTISSLPFGIYKVKVPGDDQWAMQYFSIQTTDENAAKVSISATSPDTVGINFILQPACSISGYVRDSQGKPLVDADVWVDLWDGGSSKGTKTDSDGFYVISGLSVGQYRLQAQAVGHVKRFFPDNLNYDNAKGVYLTYGLGLTNMDFTLEAGGTISGYVLDAQGKAVVGIDVGCWRTDGAGGNGTRTGNDGSYTIIGLPYGTYNVRAAGDTSEWATQYYNSQSDIKDAESVSLSTALPNLSGVNFTLEKGGTISGKVTDNNNQPLAGANVWVNLWDNSWDRGTKTDENGNFTIMGLGAGQYRVAAQAEGRVTKYNPNTINYDNAVAVVITNADTITGINFALEPGGSISGIIKNAKGNPVSGLELNCWRIDGSGGAGTQTESDGSYTFKGLPYGSYRIRAPGWQSDSKLAPQFYSGKYIEDSADSIDVSSTTPNISGINFTLQQGGSISGIVKDNQGKLLADAHVWVDTWDGDYVKGVQTDSNGFYQITGLIIGKYRLSAQADGKVKRFYPNTLVYDEAIAIEVTAFGQAITGISFALEPGGSISGVIKDEQNSPLKGIDVSCWQIGGVIGSGAKTGEDGTYCISGLPFGTYQLKAPGRVSENNIWAPQYYNGRLSYSSADTIMVSAVQPDMTNMNFILQAGRTISGTITDSAGVPLADADVWAEEWDQGWAGGAKTDNDGHYMITGLGSGPFRVGAQADNRVMKFYSNSLDYDLAKPVSVSTGNAIGIDFTLEAGGTISGVAKDAQNNPLAGIQVECWRTDGVGGNCVETADDGSYTLSGLPFGNYKVRIGLGSSNGGNWAVQYYSNKTADNQANLINISSGVPNANGIDFVVTAGSTISGVIKDTQGQPIPGANVRIKAINCGWGKETETDQAGYYSISGLAAGQYRLAAKAPGKALCYYPHTPDYEKASAIQIAAASYLNDINLVLEPGGTISGFVRDQQGNPLAGMIVDYWNSDGWQGNENETAADGSYILKGLPVGSYLVRVMNSKTGTGNWAPQYYNGRTSRSQADLVTITANNLNVSGVSFTLIAGGVVSGVVLDQNQTPIANAEVWAEFLNGGIGGWTQSGADGRYSLSGLYAGQYRICAQADGRVLKFSGDTLSYNDANLVTVTLGQTASDVNFTLEPGGSISGVVNDAQGKPLAGIEVKCWRIDGLGGNSTTSAADGSYTINGLAYGTYKIMTVGAKLASGNWAPQYYNGKVNVNGADTVIISADAPNRAGINFALSSANCFIATAAFGSYLEPHVQALRDFRDAILLKSSLGRALVAFYYKNSPPLAAIIAGNQFLRFMVRLLLTPIVLIVEFPVISVVLLGFMAAIVWFKRKRPGYNPV